MLAGVSDRFLDLVFQISNQRSCPIAEARRPLECQCRQMEPAHIVQHDHIERGGGRALFVESAHVESLGIHPAVDDLVNREGDLLYLNM